VPSGRPDSETAPASGRSSITWKAPAAYCAGPGNSDQQVNPAGEGVQPAWGRLHVLARGRAQSSLGTREMYVPQLASSDRVPLQVVSATNCAKVQVCPMYSAETQMLPCSSATAAE